jgi:predicted glutamine amidotransferase
MCGLVSVVCRMKGGLFNSDLKIFGEMLFADQLRGADGTGIFFDTHKNIQTLKGAMPASEFLVTDQYSKSEDQAIKQGHWIVGHNRAATKGKLNHECTHPFVEKHITLVHNGTLPSHKHLADVEVDSHAICHAFATEGAKATLAKLVGAFALIWYDANQKTLNFVRNSKRPLWIIETTDLFIFCSEPDMGRWICERNNKNIIKTHQIPVGVLYQFEIGAWDQYLTQPIQLAPEVSTTTYTDWFANKPSGTVKPYVPQSTTKPLDTNQASPYLGENIKWTPVALDKEFPDKIVGFYTDPDGDEFEVRYWAASRETAAKWVKEKELMGKISHVAWKPITLDGYVILSNVWPYNPGEETKKLLEEKVVPITKTKKGPKLLKDIPNIQSKCNMCGVPLGAYLAEGAVITHKNGKVSTTCAHCTAFIKREQEEAQNVQ